MELVKVTARASFVHQSIGSVNKKQELMISKPLAEYLASLDLVNYPQKQASVINAGEVTQSASLPAETASPTLTLKTSKRGKGGKR